MSLLSFYGIIGDLVYQPLTNTYWSLIAKTYTASHSCDICD